MRINLLPEEYRPKPQVRLGSLVLLMAIGLLVVGAWVMAGIAFFSHQSLAGQSAQLAEQIRDYQSQLAEARQKEALFAEVEKLRQDVEQMRGLYQEPSLILRRIASAMPDDVWMTDLAVNAGGGVQIGGGSVVFPQLGTFLDRLNQLQYFKKTRLKDVRQQKEEQLASYQYTLEMTTGRNSLEYGEK
jgi:Tfp pilus assembly protein PilN